MHCFHEKFWNKEHFAIKIDIRDNISAIIDIFLEFLIMYIK